MLCPEKTGEATRLTWIEKNKLEKDRANVVKEREKSDHAELPSHDKDFGLCSNSSGKKLGYFKQGSDAPFYICEMKNNRRTKDLVGAS